MPIIAVTVVVFFPRKRIDCYLLERGVLMNLSKFLLEMATFSSQCQYPALQYTYMYNVYICFIVLSAVNDDSSTVPGLLTDYILKGMSAFIFREI